MGSDSDSSLLLNEEAEYKNVEGESDLSFRKGKCFTCSVYQKTFKHQRALMLHHHVLHRQPEYTKEVFKMPQSQKQQCPYCKKLFFDMEYPTMCRGKKPLYSPLISDSSDTQLFDSSTEKPPVKIGRSLRSDSSPDFRRDAKTTLPDFHKKLKQLKKTYVFC